VERNTIKEGTELLPPSWSLEEKAKVQQQLKD
jgi:hypothetical protein